MSEIPQEPIGTNQLLDEATLWFARMRGPEATDHQRAFEAWLARGALHRTAYNHAAEIFSFGKFLAEEKLVAEEVQPGPDTEETPPPPPRRLSPASLLLACAVVIALGCVVLLAQPGRTGPEAMVAGLAQAELVLQTETGEGRVHRLVDGSTITLGPDTRISVRYGREQRLLTLTRGRARFEVAKEKRPFVVTALGTRVTAHGTVFDVAITGKAGVRVRLVEGRIDVVLPPTRSRPEVRRSLTPGQAMEVDGEALTAGTTARAGKSQAVGNQGRDAFHEYDAARLSDVVADANRIAAVPITLEGNGLGELRVSGRFRLADSISLANRMAAVFDLKVDRSSPTHIVLTAR